MADGPHLETYELSKVPGYPHAHVVKLEHGPGGPEITTMWVRGENDPVRIGKPPTPYDTALAFTDPATNQRLAVLGVIRIHGQVDTERPTLNLNVMGLSAFPLPDWPITFGSLSKDDPGLGVWVSLNTPATVIGEWLRQEDLEA